MIMDVTQPTVTSITSTTTTSAPTSPPTIKLEVAKLRSGISDMMPGLAKGHVTPESSCIGEQEKILGSLYQNKTAIGHINAGNLECLQGTH